MTETYSPTKFVIGYWTGTQYVISVVDTEKYDQTQPFFTSDPKCATAAIEAKMEELRDEEK